MARGARRRCPACGHAPLFSHGLSVNERCPACGEELYHQRADRIGPLFAAFLAVHVSVLTALVLQGLLHPTDGAAFFAALTVGIAAFWLLLPVTKGALIGLQWAWRLHGFQYAALCRPCPPHATPSGDKEQGRKSSAAATDMPSAVERPLAARVLPHRIGT